VTATTAVGFVLAAPNDIDGWRLLATVIGTALVGAAANAVNQSWEVRQDALMHRTRNRPLPSGRIGRRAALIHATVLAASGLAVLAAWVNVRSAGLALAALLLYVLAYTPLKRRSTLCTPVGAIVGAIPPLIGWAAAGRGLDAGAWVLFVLLFLWQIPHFLAIAWLYRDDYARAGFHMLPSVDPSGRLTCGMVVLYTLALLPASAAVAMVGLSGWVYLCGAAVLGAGFLALAIRFYRERSDTAARIVFLGSITYLPLLLGLMVADLTRL
jgi:protoheme IX farnesyltransferase